ncbi:concanavalin A-like lectin/glucanase domain-containing protein [Biscogniauxia sp. FL1348]|nr:concanavalin A-like lectin/glucanase domain-containing protein [Biscogniauxia sp. FL1348]
MSSRISIPRKEDLRNFDPLKATPEELEKAHYPPRPSQTLEPNQYALWQNIAARNPRFVGTGLRNVGLQETKNWSGAVLPAPSQEPAASDTPTASVSGSWRVPKCYPVKDDDGEVKDGEYRLWTWIGLDGWGNDVALKIGVDSVLKVVEHKVVEESYTAALLFRGPTEESIVVVVIEGFTVVPGDLLTATVWGHVDDNIGTASIYNQGSNERGGGRIHAAEGVYLKGQSAEWIAAGRNPDDPRPYLFPEYGATVFFHGYATLADSSEASIDRAFLIDAKDVNSIAERGGTVLVHSFLQEA